MVLRDKYCTPPIDAALCLDPEPPIFFKVSLHPLRRSGNSSASVTTCSSTYRTVRVEFLPCRQKGEHLQHLPVPNLADNTSRDTLSGSPWTSLTEIKEYHQVWIICGLTLNSVLNREDVDVLTGIESIPNSDTLCSGDTAAPR